MKSSNLSADNFKKTVELSGSIPEPVILVSRNTILTAVNQSKHGCTISGCRLPN